MQAESNEVRYATLEDLAKLNNNTDTIFVRDPNWRGGWERGTPHYMSRRSDYYSHRYSAHDPVVIIADHGLPALQEIVDFDFFNIDGVRLAIIAKEGDQQKTFLSVHYRANKELRIIFHPDFEVEIQGIRKKIQNWPILLKNPYHHGHCVESFDFTLSGWNETLGRKPSRSGRFVQKQYSYCLNQERHYS